MSFKAYFEEYLSTMKTKIKDFMSLIESKSFKVLVILGEENSKIFSKDPQKIDLEEYKGTIIYCKSKALLISEYGNHKMMDDERVKDLENKFQHLAD